MRPPANKLIVLGLERCGTHTLADLIRVAANNQFESWHETKPFLCHESYSKFCNHKYDKRDLSTKFAQHSDRKVICEANHRFSFFVPEIAAAFPDSKFLLLVREPVETLISRFANLSFVSEILPHIPEEIASKMVDNYFHDYNAFRIKPLYKCDPYQYFLYDLVNTVRFAIRDLSKLNPDRYKIIHINRLPDHVVDILNWIDHTFEWNFDAAYKQATVRSDSVYTKSDRSDLLKYAKEMFIPRRQEIETEFLLAATGRGMPESFLPNFLSGPVEFIRNVR